MPTENKEETLLTPTKKFKRSVVSIKNKNNPGDVGAMVFSKYVNRVAPRRIPTTLLTSSMIDIICASLSIGHSAEFCAAGAGISYASLQKYIRLGSEDYQRFESLEAAGVTVKESDYTLHFELYARFQNAIFDAQDGPLQVIRDASDRGDWRAAAYFLERRFPKHWGKKTEQKVENVNPATTTTVILVPQRVENVEDWQGFVEDDRAGTLEYVPQEAIDSQPVKQELPELD